MFMEEDTIPTYVEIRNQVLAPFCYRCHSAAAGNRAGVNLESYATVRKNITKIYSAAVVQKTMPPRRPLPQSGYELLRVWIEGGAPQNEVTK